MHYYNVFRKYQLEAYNIVGPFEGSKPRQVLIPDESALEKLLNDLNFEK